MSTIAVESYLRQVKAEQGEEVWRQEVRRLAIAATKVGGKHETYWRKLIGSPEYAWLDWGELLREAKPMQGPEALMGEMLRQQMPGIKSQAQYNAVLGALDAFRLTVNALLSSDQVKAVEGRKALDMAMDVIAKATEVTNRLEEVPEAATSKTAAAFKDPPAEFHEYDAQRQLLSALPSLHSLDELSTWYAETKGLRDKVVSQGLRNELLDAIRVKKHELTV